MHIEDTQAGKLATAAVPTCTKESLVGSVLETIKAHARIFDSIGYIYVLEQKVLVGVFSIHELLSAQSTQHVSSIMTSNVAFVHIHTDREHVADMALAQSIKAVPVVADNGEFLGVVLSDSILHIFNEEHTDYLYKSTGIRPVGDTFHTDLSLLGQVRTRTPWLFLGLIGGIFAAIIIEFFEETIATEIAIAAFIPAIVYIADAVGNQTEMLIVRALSKPDKISILKYLWREWRIGFVISILLSIAICVMSYVWIQDVRVSVILGISVILTVWFSMTVTVLLPWVFNTLKYDPAIASGPLATVICDISSVTIYLLIAAALL